MSNVRMTKSQLIDENIRLRATLDVLERKVASLEAAQKPSTTQPAAPKIVIARELPSHFALAREMAMRTGRVVKVG